MRLIIYVPTPVKPNNQILFCPNNRWCADKRRSY